MDDPLEPLTDEELEGLRLSEPPRMLPLIDVPSPRTRRFLFPTEKFRREWRRHWWDPVLAIAVSGLAAGRALRPVDPEQVRLPAEIVGVSTADTLHWILVVIAVLAAWRTLTWPWWRIVLTDQRIIVVRGLLWYRTTTIPLPLAATVRSYQSPLGQVLGYGTLAFGRPWWAAYRIGHLPAFYEIYLRIMEETFEPDAIEARSPYFDDLDDL